MSNARNEHAPRGSQAAISGIKSCLLFNLGRIIGSQCNADQAESIITQVSKSFDEVCKSLDLENQKLEARILQLEQNNVPRDDAIRNRRNMLHSSAEGEDFRPSLGCGPPRLPPFSSRKSRKSYRLTPSPPRESEPRVLASDNANTSGATKRTRDDCSEKDEPVLAETRDCPNDEEEQLTVRKRTRVQTTSRKDNGN